MFGAFDRDAPRSQDRANYNKQIKVRILVEASVELADLRCADETELKKWSLWV
jgi:hypothetical protein